MANILHLIPSWRLLALPFCSFAIIHAALEKPIRPQMDIQTTTVGRRSIYCHTDGYHPIWFLEEIKILQGGVGFFSRSNPPYLFCEQLKPSSVLAALLYHSTEGRGRKSRWMHWTSFSHGWKQGSEGLFCFKLGRPYFSGKPVKDSDGVTRRTSCDLCNLDEMFQKLSTN